MAKIKLPPKKEVMLALLERSSVFIHLDPRSEAVHVPPWLKKQPHLVLQVGLKNMAIPIVDLSVDDEAISCTLSFSRSPHFCYVPWGAVYALVGEDSKGMVWPHDIPPEVVAQQSGAKQKAKPRPKLRAVKGGGDGAAGSDEDDHDSEEPSAPDAALARAPEAATEREDPSAADDAVAGEPGGQSEAATDSPDRHEPRGLPSYLRVIK